ncbi:MAG: type II toxin-antitoxin system VapC family toxin [Hyphomicrobiaceae bacterium]|nr:type II toxin-antitoxin system VapC family toxin [Hyphomicrobiaceae bacterium]
MIVDTSALIAILLNEPEEGAFLDILEKTNTIKISAVTVLEASIVMHSRYGANGVDKLHALLHGIGAQEMAFNPEQRMAAEKAFTLYGMGQGHKAQLNFGDCITYALAKTTEEPLLFKGNDFTHTDLDLALSR